MVRALAQVAVLAAVVAAAFGWALAHPGDSVSACGTYGAFDFDTLELDQHVQGYGRAIELAVEGKAVTFDYQLATGETVDVRYQGLLSGPRASRTTTRDASYRIPPTVYKSTAWIEANWNNAASSVPYGGVGPTLRSFDCGYGLGQVTSGMGNNTGFPSARQAIIGTHFLFNIAEGVRILADKWNSAPRFRPIAGDGDPNALEDWYYAIWSYNGFAFSNHPLNPDRNPLRGEVYHCEDPSAPGHGSFFYSNYTYPERVYGCMRHPPYSGAARMWEAQAFVMPALDREVVAGAFSTANFLACQAAGFEGGASACVAMDYPTTLPDDPATDEDDPIWPHNDSTSLVDPGWAAAFLGDPVLQVAGPTEVTLNAYTDGTADRITVTVGNAGSWIAPFRVHASVPWIVARHPGASPTVTFDGGVAVGAETAVVLQKAAQVNLNVVLTTSPILPDQLTTIDVNTTANIDVGDIWVLDNEHVFVTAVLSGTQVLVVRGHDGTAAVSHVPGTPMLWLRPAVTRPGSESELLVTLVPGLVPSGGGVGYLWVEPLFGTGTRFEMRVEAVKPGPPLKFRVLAPGIAAE